MMKRWIFAVGLILLFAAEILRVYFIMPFPGSQRANTLAIAYFINKHIWAIRIFAIILLIFPVYDSFGLWKKWQKALFIVVTILYLGIFYLVNFKFLADKMFYQPRTKMMVPASASKISPEKLVVGITINNESRAYPIEIIGYHHQVLDTVGGEPVIVTYCTVCRTGRVYSPIIKGKMERFRLVGMDHFNAMFEDHSTKSWWRQVSGVAVAGPSKGQSLKELPSQQMQLSAWLREHPSSLIMQEDPAFLKNYADLAGFDKGTVKSGLEKRDTASWKPKSWIVGIVYNGQSKAYDWNELLAQRVINDSLPQLPCMISIEPDNASYHVWDRRQQDQVLRFTRDSLGIRDENTGSYWNDDGFCTNGPLIGRQLVPVQASQEFWHSWSTFHPNTSVYK